MRGTLETSGAKTAIYLDLGVTGQVVKASKGDVVSWVIANKHADAFRYVKFYNKATAATEADTPVAVVPIPFGATSNIEWQYGFGQFPAGISVRATTGAANDDAGAPTAGDVIATIGYI